MAAQTLDDASRLITEYDENFSALETCLDSTIDNMRLPLLGLLCGDLPHRVVWKMMYLSHGQTQIEARCTMLSVVTDYIANTPVLLEATSKENTSPVRLIQFLSKCWLYGLHSAKKYFDKDNFSKIVNTLERSVAALTSYDLHRLLTPALDLALRLQNCGTEVVPVPCTHLSLRDFPTSAIISYPKLRRYQILSYSTVKLPVSSTKHITLKSSCFQTKTAHVSRAGPVPSTTASSASTTSATTDRTTLTPQFGSTYPASTAKPAYPAATSRPTYSAPTSRPTYSAPTSRPTYSAPTSTPTYSAATSRSTYSSSTSRPTYSSSTSRPTYSSATSRPTCSAATSRPTYPVPTSKPTYSIPTSRPTYSVSRAPYVPKTSLTLPSTTIKPARPNSSVTANSQNHSAPNAKPTVIANQRSFTAETEFARSSSSMSTSWNKELLPTVSSVNRNGSRKLTPYSLPVNDVSSRHVSGKFTISNSVPHRYSHVKGNHNNKTGPASQIHDIIDAELQQLDSLVSNSQHSLFSI